MDTIAEVRDLQKNMFRDSCSMDLSKFSLLSTNKIVLNYCTPPEIEI